MEDYYSCGVCGKRFKLSISAEDFVSGRSKEQLSCRICGWTACKEHQRVDEGSRCPKCGADALWEAATGVPI